MASKIATKINVIKNNKYKCKTISEIFPETKEDNVKEWVGGGPFTDIMEASVSVALPSLVKRNFVRRGAVAEEELHKDITDMETNAIKNIEYVTLGLIWRSSGAYSGTLSNI